jgi:Asp-tRNA(Asn)/Glu-tRNA(Gln) amidotransferase C subunit
VINKESSKSNDCSSKMNDFDTRNIIPDINEFKDKKWERKGKERKGKERKGKEREREKWKREREKKRNAMKRGSQRG